MQPNLETRKNQRDVFLETIEYLKNPPPAISLNDWPMFTRFTGGFRKHEFSVFTGPSGKGKTTLLTNVSAQLLKQGVKHFVMPIEGGRMDYMARVLSVLEGRDLNDGERLDPSTAARLAAKHFEHLDRDCIEFSTHEDRLGIDTLLDELTHMSAVEKCELAIIDNFNFFQEVVSAQNQIVEMDRVMHKMIMWCKSNPMHLFMVFHPRKNNSIDVYVESEYDVKGSSTAIQEAQNVFLFNPPRKEAIEKGDAQPTDREVRIAKMRRRGMHVGKRVFFHNSGTRYIESGATK